MPNEQAWIASFTGGPGRAQGGASDLEALSARDDVRLMPMYHDAHRLLDDLPSLGRVDYTTRNASVTCTRREAVRTVLPLGEGTTVFGDADGLRWLESSWCHTVAVLSRGADFTATPPCLLLFGESGDLAHQVTLPDPAAWEAFITLVQRHHCCGSCLRQRTVAPGSGTAADCPVWMLREAWSSAGSERDLEVRLERLGLNRLLALRSLEGLYTSPLSAQDLATFLKGLAASALPVHVQLGNRHCTQVLESPLEGLSFGSGEWELRMAQATLRLDPSRMDSIWSVAQPVPGGERHRVECYDAAGERVLTLSRPHDPSPLVHLGWQRLTSLLDEGKSV